MIMLPKKVKIIVLTTILIVTGDTMVWVLDTIEISQVYSKGLTLTEIVGVVHYISSLTESRIKP